MPNMRITEVTHHEMGCLQAGHHIQTPTVLYTHTNLTAYSRLLACLLQQKWGGFCHLLGYRLLNNQYVKDN